MKKILFVLIIIAAGGAAYLYIRKPQATNLSAPNGSVVSASSTGLSQSPILHNEYHINAPNTLILVDSQGRRTGKDPITGTIYQEIPNTTYAEEGLSQNNKSGELFFSQKASDQYTLYVLGGKNGSYAVDAYINAPYFRAEKNTGNIEAGDMVIYSVNYYSPNVISSILELKGAASSTTSIIPSPRSYEYHTNLPNTLILMDKQGRRTGKDPVTGVFYHEIPRSGYGEVGHSSELIFSALPTERYMLYALGGKTGAYWIDGWPSGHATGTVEQGAMNLYTLTLSADGTPELMFQATISSTASITSAPPNNLPL